MKEDDRNDYASLLVVVQAQAAQALMTLVRSPDASLNRMNLDLNVIVSTTNKLVGMLAAERVRIDNTADRIARGEPTYPPPQWQREETRVDTELSHVWGRNNPEFFVDAVTRFQEEHPIADWEHRVSMHRDGFTTFIAIKRKKLYSIDADFLREVGYDR